jgi:hypothetical protein
MSRQEELPDATRLAFVVARSGAVEASRDGLRKSVPLFPETREDLLADLVAAGQVTVGPDGQKAYLLAGYKESARLLESDALPR